MKKKLLSILLATILVFSLSITSSAIGTTDSLRADGTTVKTGDPAQVSALLATVMTNRATLLTIKSQNITRAAQLKTLLKELKDSGATIPEDTLTQLTALKDQLKAAHEQLAATKGQLDGLMQSFRQYRQAKDFENAAAVLQQVITIQEARISLQTQIGGLTQQMLDLFSAI